MLKAGFPHFSTIMHLFYIPGINSQKIQLSEDESKHALRVLRLGQGDLVGLVDGSGGKYEAVISEAHPKRCFLEITSHIQNWGYRPYKIKIAVAPTKNLERTEWFVEKATEIGIDEIIFLLCDRSERKTINLDRLEKIVVSAMKQSVKAYKPILQDMTLFKDFISDLAGTETYIAHLEEHEQKPLHQIIPSSSCCVLIGPEGDFSPQEITQAYTAGIKPVTLGSSRLRTETAALAACHTLNLLHEMNAVK